MSRHAQLSAGTADRAIIDVLVPGFASAAFDVAAPDVEIRADRSRISPVRRNLRWCTDGRRLLRAQERIAAVDKIGPVTRTVFAD